MKKIREFAVLCGTTPKTLRFYDKIGLLEASYIDPENGYRYYNDEQIRDFGTISCFKAIGFTLDEIKNEILNSDDEHILEILHRRKAELKRSLRLCREQIGLYEKRIHPDAAVNEVTLYRYDDEQKIVVSNKNITRTFTCPEHGMEICAEAINELFITNGYINISLEDLPESDENRTALIQMLEGTREEVFSADFSDTFNTSDDFEPVQTVLMAIKTSGETTRDDVNSMVEKCLNTFPESCTVLWGVSFDYALEDHVKLCMIGLY